MREFSDTGNTIELFVGDRRVSVCEIMCTECRRYFWIDNDYDLTIKLRCPYCSNIYWEE